MSISEVLSRFFIALAFGSIPAIIIAIYIHGDKSIERYCHKEEEKRKKEMQELEERARRDICPCLNCLSSHCPNYDENCPYFKEWQSRMANKSKNAEDIYHNENIFTKISKFPSDDYIQSKMDEMYQRGLQRDKEND